MSVVPRQGVKMLSKRGSQNIVFLLSNGEPIRFFSTMPPVDFLFVEKVFKPFLDCIAVVALLRVSPVLDGRLIDEWTECAVSLFFSTKSPTDFLPFGPIFIPLLMIQKQQQPSFHQEENIWKTRFW